MLSAKERKELTERNKASIINEHESLIQKFLIQIDSKISAATSTGSSNCYILDIFKDYHFGDRLKMIILGELKNRLEQYGYKANVKCYAVYISW